MTQAELDGFRAYLGEFGLAEGSIDIYVHAMKRALEEGGVLERLKGDAIAPKTKRLVRAAARHWATWREDHKLRNAMERIRLPAPRRQTAKVPLEKAPLFQIMDEIDRDHRAAHPTMPPAVRAVLGLMAWRGFRDGDCLRMKRSEIKRALATGVLSYRAKGNRQLEFRVLKNFRRWLSLLDDQPGKWQRVDELVAPRSKNARARRATAAKTIQRALGAIGRRLGIDDLHPHRLRRTYCVEYLRALKGDSEALVKLQQHMQWAGLATAMEYVDHARAGELDTVAEGLFDR